MKIKLSRKQIESILADPDKALEAGVKASDPGATQLMMPTCVIGPILASAVITDSLIYPPCRESGC